MARKIPGIYVPIRLTYEQLKTDLDRAKALAREQGQAMSDAINGALSPRTMSSGLTRLTSDLATAGRAATASRGAFKGLVDEFGEIASAAGVSRSRMDELAASMVRQSASQAAERAFANIQRSTGASSLQMARLRLELGDASGALRMAGTAAMAFTPYVAAAGVAAGAAAMATFRAAMEVERLNRAYTTIYGSTTAARQQLQFIYDTTQRLGLEFRSTAESAKTFFASGKGTALEADMNSIFTAVSEAGAALSLSQADMQGIYLAIGQMISKGKVQAEELRGQLGERLPGAFRLAAQAMGLTTAELDKLLEQGRVTADDLLPKLARALRTEYTGGASEAQKATSGLSTEWERFKASASQTGAIVAGINAVKDALKGASDAMEAHAQRAATIAAMEKAGITKRVSYDPMTGDRTEGYAQEQIDAYLARIAAGNRQRDGAFVDQTNAAEALDAALGKARQAANAFLKDTDAAKIQKINDSYSETETAITRVIERLRDAGESTDYWEGKLAEAAKERDRQLASVGKNEAAAAGRAAAALREVNEALAGITGDEAQAAQLRFSKNFEKWKKDIGSVTPEMERLKAAAEEAFAKGFATIQEYRSARKAFLDQGRDRETELSFLRNEVAVQAGGNLDKSEIDRARALAELENKRRDWEKVGSREEVEKQVALEVERIHLTTAQRNMQVEQQFYQMAAGLLKNREDLQARILDREMSNYRKVVQDKTLLAEVEARKMLEISQAGSDGAKLAFIEYAEAASNAASQWKEATKKALDGMADAITDWAMGAQANIEAVGEAFARMIIKAQVEQNITGPLAKAFGSINWGGLFTPSAQGNVFSGPGISAYRNSVVNKPTLFPFAHGIGLMGEAGEEAIMPLGRTSRGDLGVKVAGGTGGMPTKFEVRVINEGGQPVQARRTEMRFDQTAAVMTIWLKGWANNIMGVRDAVASGA